MESGHSPQTSFEGMTLSQLLARAELKFQTRFEKIKVSDTVLEMLQIANMQDYLEQMAASIDAENGLDLPFWARIWPTSILLSYYIQRMPATPDKHLLEIGAGIGLCGLFAAKHGLRVTISDIHEDALLFAQINILKNNLQHLADVRRIDFTTDRMQERFDLILGSEVLYQENSYRPLTKFLTRHIRNSQASEIILAKSYHLKAGPFFRAAQKEFMIQEKILGYKEQEGAQSSEKDKHLCQIYRLRPKKLS